jgi:hypothetical protein
MLSLLTSPHETISSPTIKGQKMSNFWLKEERNVPTWLKETLTFENSVIDFQQSIKNGQCDSGMVDQYLNDVFYDIAAIRVKPIATPHILDQVKIIEACIIKCFEKIIEFNPKKDIAYDFFVNVVRDKIRDDFGPIN